MKKLKLFCVFAFLSFFGACVPDVEPVIPTWVDNHNKDVVSEYDHWGKVHNEGLDAIAKRLKDTDLKGQDTNLVIMKLVLEFTGEKTPLYQDGNKTPQELDNSVKNLDLSHLSSNGQKLYADLENKLNTFYFDTIPNSNYIKKFQKEIYDGVEANIRRSNVTIDDKENLLRACAIARYSVAYWYTEFYKVWKSQNAEASVWQSVLQKLFPKPNPKSERAYPAARAESSIPKKDVKGGSKTEPQAIGASAAQK